MAKSPMKSLRVTPGSALERLTEGKPFTETVHKMAELFEKALDENWGPPPMTATIYVSNDGRVMEQRGSGPLMEISHEQVGSGYDPGAVGYELQGRDSRPSKVDVQWRDGTVEEAALVIRGDAQDRVVTREEALRIAAEQAPAGLVPVWDEGDEAEDNFNNSYRDDRDYGDGSDLI